MEFEYEFIPDDEENEDLHYEKTLSVDQLRLHKIEEMKSGCFDRIAKKIEKLANRGHFSPKDALSFIQRIEHTFSLYGFQSIEKEIDSLLHISEIRGKIRNLIGQVLYKVTGPEPLFETN